MECRSIDLFFERNFRNFTIRRLPLIHIAWLIIYFYVALDPWSVEIWWYMANRSLHTQVFTTNSAVCNYHNLSSQSFWNNKQFHCFLVSNLCWVENTILFGKKTPTKPFYHNLSIVFFPEVQGLCEIAVIHQTFVHLTISTLSVTLLLYRRLISFLYSRGNTCSLDIFFFATMDLDQTDF